MGHDAAPTATPSPSPSPSPSSSGASPSPSSPRAKRRRTDRYTLGFEFAPRLAPYEVLVSPPRPSSEWTEGSTFALLDAWGDRFARSGSRGIRADEWLEVARMVAVAADRPVGYFSEAQCRNRVDTLRKKFKKERERVRRAARRSRSSPSSKWVYYEKMVSIICPPQPQQQPPPGSLPLLLSPVMRRRRDTIPSPRLSWGVNAPESLLGGGGDAGPRNSRSDAKLGELRKIETVAESSNGFVVLRESILKFGKVFETMESAKRQHMAEVEQMRKDFLRDLDAKWKEILEKAQVEIASLGDEEVDDGDAEEDGNGGVDNERLEDGGGEEQNNGPVDASP